MPPKRSQVLAWWCTLVALPLALLALAAVALGRTTFDRGSLEPFFDQEAGEFTLRRDWFFDGVLHIGGRALVASGVVLMVLGAVAGWRNVRFGANARRCAYLAVSVLLTVVIAGAWKRGVDQVTPWDTIGFGGTQPWPGTDGSETWTDVVGSPGAHASSGFAWIALFFVGLSLDTRHRWLWLVPGILLGLLFAVGQHVRGAHQPSHEFWSLAIAWGAATTTALGFRRAGWLQWSEASRESFQRPKADLEPDPILPWLVGTSMALLGAAFFALDRMSGELEVQYAALHHKVELVELVGMALGLGVTAWLMTERVGTLRARSAQRLEQERARRLQLLGRMAASVAHEVRNPLHTLRLIVDEQRLDIPALDAHALRPELETCIERINRAVELVYRLARPETGDVETSDLPGAVREALVSLERLAPGRVQFEWSRPPRPASVSVSHAPLGIVLDNVLRNAAEAAPAGSTVTLDLVEEPSTWIMKINNEGSLGGRKGTPDREPGLGLGMSISQQIVASVGGRLEIAEARGIVQCTLWLPREPEPIG